MAEICVHCRMTPDDAAGGACDSLSGPRHRWIKTCGETRWGVLQTDQGELRCEREPFHTSGVLHEAHTASGIVRW